MHILFYHPRKTFAKFALVFVPRSVFSRLFFDRGNHVFEQPLYRTIEIIDTRSPLFLFRSNRLTIR